MGFADVRRHASDLALDNVTFADWISIERLSDCFARATICLGGHFSTVPEAARVIATKTFQFMAMGKPTIVGDNPATRELFRPEEHVLAVQKGDPAALAQAIERLTDDRAQRDIVALAGHNVFQNVSPRSSSRVISLLQPYLTPWRVARSDAS